MVKIFIILSLIILIVYLGIGSFLFIKQREFLYFPAPAISHKYSEITFKHDNEKIKVVSLNFEKPQAILYFGGNAESVEYNIDAFSHNFPNHNIYLTKYRGYGGSTGNATEEKLYADALYIFDQLQKNHDNISIIGRSLGSGVASYVASKRHIKKLALITPFDSVQNVAQKSFPLYPMSLLLKDKYDSISRAHSIKAKTLIIVAENDQIINEKHSNRLFDALTPSLATKIMIKNTDHNSISENKEYYQSMNEFFQTND